MSKPPAAMPSHGPVAERPGTGGGGSSRPLILSASRRTDLPGFAPRSCAERIRKRTRRLRTRALYGVVFWTKHVDAFLPGAALHDLVRHELSNPILNLTVTGLGASTVEPRVPHPDTVLEKLEPLVRTFHDEPWRIRWRFDPIIYQRSSLKTFERLARAMRAAGIETCTFSFPSEFSWKGNLRDQFRAAGIVRWPEDEKGAFVREMVDIATPIGLTLSSCCQPENHRAGVRPAQCIPPLELMRGHPERLPLPLTEDRSQRRHCHCIESEDIGDYETDTCGSGCAYCYSRCGGPWVRARPDSGGGNGVQLPLL